MWKHEWDSIFMIIMPKARGYRIMKHTVDVEMEALPNWKTFTKHFLFYLSFILKFKLD